jgi:hypothetical protein
VDASLSSATVLGVLQGAIVRLRSATKVGKVGFRPVGVMRRCERDADGTWHDNLLMDLLASEFEDR